MSFLILILWFFGIVGYVSGAYMVWISILDNPNAGVVEVLFTFFWPFVIMAMGITTLLLKLHQKIFKDKQSNA